MNRSKIGVVGAGTMGEGIAQVAAQAGHRVVLVDINESSLKRAQSNFQIIFSKMVDKGKISSDQMNEIINKISFSTSFESLSNCGFVIEAIVENIDIKNKVFAELEAIVSDDCILASNTSSLSIASIGSVLKKSDRIIGVHFFNPAPLMPLVEIIPSVQTSSTVLNYSKSLIDSWGKLSVVVKDTPGFIVNRVARPFYGEALRIYEEGIADFSTIDWVMTEIGGFRMGPFTLMDYIGNDVNYAVTESVFNSFYFDPRFKPSFTQKRHVEAGFYGRKTGRGYYNYDEMVETTEPVKDLVLGQQIFERIIVMLINEAYDALFMNIASKEDIEIAMTKGVNYPKGLFQWAEEIGLKKVLLKLESLFIEYGEDRYRPNPLLKRVV